MREVARKAGVSHQAPYHHFAGRDALMRELRDNAMREFLADQERAAARHDDPAARMLAVAMAYVDFARRRPRAFALVFDTDLCPPHDRTPSRDALITANEELFARCLADLRAVGWRPGVDPDGLGLGVWAAVHGTAALVTGGYMPPDQAERALRAVFAGAA